MASGLQVLFGEFAKLIKGVQLVDLNFPALKRGANRMGEE
jgi:hypothetical protein